MLLNLRLTDITVYSVIDTSSAGSSNYGSIEKVEQKFSGKATPIKKKKVADVEHSKMVCDFDRNY